MQNVGPVQNILAAITYLLPSHEKKLPVEDLAAAMKVEFEQRQSKQIAKVAYYQPDETLTLAAQYY